MRRVIESPQFCCIYWPWPEYDGTAAWTTLKYTVTTTLHSHTRSALIAVAMVASLSAVQEGAAQETVERVPTLCHESFDVAAFEPIEKVLEQKPDASVHFYLAECYRSFGKNEAAMDHYMKAFGLEQIIDFVKERLEEAEQARDEPEIIKADHAVPRDGGPSR